ncbi:unknown [Tannerella sp. CAG:118]|uniref:Uncharacterized protein n=1 Tax=Coprobacter secundus subsp. similis TaxID=2751153 RepID=A0A7G1HTG1_9BACT|nr:hypothetical protein Cop2CBH44_12790 [Coprobacter secundus subsp. similis]CCY38038.1 unknown [Tannerella sp. CAG:118]
MTILTNNNLLSPKNIQNTKKIITNKKIRIYFLLLVHSMIKYNSFYFAH